MHPPIFLSHISLYFPGKICFEYFSAQIQAGNRIAIIGNNGTGKSSLLKIIKGDLPASEGEIQNKNVSFGYVPQLIYEYENLSGGEKFNRALSVAFSNHPDILLLDEPTNHLDLKNRRSLIKMLNFYKGTLVVVSHDTELLRSSIDILWRIDNGKVSVFNGKYDDYRQTIMQERQNIENELEFLAKEKKENHKALMKEQQRAKKNKERGRKFVERKKWLPALGDLNQSYAQKTTGKNKGSISNKRKILNERLSSLRLPEIIKPSFSLTAKNIASKTIVSISSGQTAYGHKIISKDINLSVTGSEHLAVTGGNGSGKTTLFRAILNYPQIKKTGVWDLPRSEDIGYLDQCYSSLNDIKTVLETLADLSPEKTHAEIRDFLNDFLFRKNEEVNKQVSVLSGGEKARLSLAKIALQTPRLLLIDEITNNIDLETKEHVTQALKEYPGAMIIISHDSAFLENIGITHYYKL
ncbi:ABC-F family ATP-binding cassette domain-containing protein [Candidatus Endomicrobiellum trichonymphae]|uniref:Dupulicated ATPase component protein n=1 Tax=Endomicrobium trichonymphae TaxID=1408204 RepID=B1GZ62_ENDTX|nr:ATP-binding cassette domain-containing protein [Candidatus Endomicrobium trichonymphae]BAG13544.1 dupulicated ATPase component protein [Candidatus Endomicrobium trichonymphae]